MALELKHYSILVFNMFRNAVITFPKTDTMHMVLQSNVLAKSKENELIQYIEKVFCERCAFSLKVEAEYQEAKESKVRKNSRDPASAGSGSHYRDVFFWKTTKEKNSRLPVKNRIRNRKPRRKK